MSLPLAVQMGARLYIPYHDLTRIWEQDLTGTPNTHPDADADVIGQIDLCGTTPGRLVATSTGSRPPLASTNRASYAEHTTSHLTLIERSKLMVGWWHASFVGTLVMWMRPADDNVTRILWDQCNSSGGSGGVGYSLLRNSNGTLQVVFVNGNSQTVVNGNTPDGSKEFISTTTANGWAMVVFRMAGYGTNLGSLGLWNQAGSRVWADHVFNTNLSGFARPAETLPTTKDIGIGCRSDASSPTGRWSGGIGGVALFDTALNDTDLGALAQDNPARTSVDEITRALAAGDELDPDELSDLLYHFDVRTPTGVAYQERTSPTTVCANGDSVGYVRNLAGSYLDRDMAANGDGTKPTYIDNAFGTGIGSLRFDGAGTQFMEWFPQAKGGDLSWIMIVRQNDASFGSHLLRAGNSYFVITGTGYGGSPTGPRLVLHSGTLVSPLYGMEGASGPFIASELVNAYCGSTGGFQRKCGVNGRWGTELTDTGGSIAWSGIGGDAVNDFFDIDGDVLALIMYNRRHTDENLSRVMRKYGNLVGFTTNPQFAGAETAVVFDVEGEGEIEDVTPPDPDPEQPPTVAGMTMIPRIMLSRKRRHLIWLPPEGI